MIVSTTNGGLAGSPGPDTASMAELPSPTAPLVEDPLSYRRSPESCHGCTSFRPLLPVGAAAVVDYLRLLSEISQ
jgi:hypothetical protein